MITLMRLKKLNDILLTKRKKIIKIYVVNINLHRQQNGCIHAKLKGTNRNQHSKIIYNYVQKKNHTLRNSQIWHINK